MDDNVKINYNTNPLKLPTFDSLESDGGCLLCPACGGNYLHHNKVEVFECGEDDKGGLHVVVGGAGDVKVDRAMTGNPSSRRHGLRIHFWCEMCSALPFLDLSQHKGNTYLGMGSVEGKNEQ